MTEAEAKTKWCPMVRYDDQMANRDEPHHSNANCIASACMMWRWRGSEPECDQGYCGLAGEP